MARTRRVRIVCISDTHNQTPKLPPGDIFIHAGDLTKQGSPEELQRAFHWLDGQDFRCKIIVAGNHDLGLDRQFQDQGRSQTAEQVQANIDLFQSSPSMHYLEHEAKCIILPNHDGTETRLKVFGSPYSPKHGKWAFGYNRSAELELWQAIPLDSDIVITHTPARYHVDESIRDGPGGCENLRQDLWRVRPKLFVCGHIHEASGVELVEWDLGTANVTFKEKHSQQIEDQAPGTNKQFVVKLSADAKSPLQNDGSLGDLALTAARPGKWAVEVKDKGDQRHDLDLNLYTGCGGSVADPRTDRAALAGRRGRCQTCVVNASYKKTDWPYKESQGKFVNKPVVVELDLPIGHADDT